MDNVIDSDRSGLGAPARPPVASFAIREDEVTEPSPAARVFSAPGWMFHVACALAALSTAWAASSPTGLDLTGDRFAWAGLLAVLVWVVRLAGAASRRTVTAGFLAAPVMAGAVAGAVYLEIPEEARWLHAEGDFERTLRALPAAKDWDQAVADEVTPGRIGSYSVTGVARDAAGAAQFEVEGAAFTYLVDGPTQQVRDAHPEHTFKQLHGNWYLLRADR